MHNESPNSGKEIVEVKLNPQGDFFLIMNSDVIGTPPRLLTGLKLVYKDKILTQEYVEIVYIRKYFKLFGLKPNDIKEENRFFRVVKKKHGDVRVPSIQCIFDGERFIGKVEAETISEILNSAFNGYSTKFLNGVIAGNDAWYHEEATLKHMPIYGGEVSES